VIVFTILGMVSAAFLLLEAVLWAPQVWDTWQYKRRVRR
jgi:hypothetical protein